MDWMNPFGNFKFTCEESIQALYDSDHLKELKQLISRLKSFTGNSTKLSGADGLLSLGDIIERIIDPNNFEDKRAAIKKLMLKLALVIQELNEKEIKKMAEEYSTKMERDTLATLKNLQEQLENFKSLLEESFKKLRSEYEKLSHNERFWRQGLQIVQEKLTEVAERIDKNTTDLSKKIGSELRSAIPSIAESVPPSFQNLVPDLVEHIAQNLDQDMHTAVNRIRKNLEETADRKSEVLQGDAEPLHKEPKQEEIQQKLDVEFNEVVEKRLREKTDKLISEPLKPGEDREQKAKEVEQLRSQVMEAFKKCLGRHEEEKEGLTKNLAYEQKLNQTAAAYKKQLDDLQNLQSQLRNGAHEQSDASISFSSSEPFRNPDSKEEEAASQKPH